ncbi:MAG: amino acid carrier protein [Bacteroidota bacterium]|nr:amino acid carrier protein [Bacteroidota bacterium]
MDLASLNDILKLIDRYIGGSSWFVFALLGTGLFFTFYLKFPQIRFFKHAIDVVRGKYDKKGAKGDTSHFQSLATALSGTVGTGNIAGVAFAIHLGGPAALFWMIVTAALGMTTKFVEVTLSHKYREFAQDGSAAGGPMYYMKNKLNLKWMAALFAIATIISSFGTGNMPQVNSIAASLKATFGIEEMITGAVLSVLLGLIILGGIRRIAAVTEKLVPIMAIIYVLGAFSVIVVNYENIIPSFVSIFSDIFTGSSAAGGFLGATIAYAFNRGVNRGLFSNEAGQGSAPIAHAAAKAEHPMSEGIVAILEPFIDTVVICSITGLTLLSSGVWNEKHQIDFSYSDMIIMEGEVSKEVHGSALYEYFNESKTGFDVTPINEFTGKLKVSDGIIASDATVLHARSIAEDVQIFKEGQPFTGFIEISEGRLQDQKGYTFSGKSLVHSAPLTAIAFNKGLFGDFGQYIVAIGLLLFAFSTAISWSYYGGRSVTYLFGVKYVNYYRVLYVIGFFLAAIIDTTIIWTFAGIAIALMTLPNLIGIFLLRKDMKNIMVEYQDFIKKEFNEDI